MICQCCGFNPEDKSVAAVGQAISFTRLERTVFDYLAKNFGREVTTDRLTDAMYRDDPNGGPVTASNVLSVVVMKIKSKIEPHDLVIESCSGKAAYRRLRWSANK